ncbi:MAG TPA: amino acid adenylation domain-containing protein, partial [Herpetosiphonaceae bacterium]
ERQAVLLDWNATRREYDVERSIHALFAAQVAARPDAPAVVFAGEQLSYAALDARAARLARCLQEHGVGPESRVGVCVERSPDMIVCVLAIWKAGGAYVALDPGYPADRLAFMLADSRPLVLLTQQSCLDLLPPTEIPLICLEDALSPVAAAIDAPLPACANGHNLAYVVYTSGSTGQPKGVMVEHHSLVNAFCAWRDGYDLRPGMRHLQMASFSFDVFAGDLVRALCSGGTLVICPREVLIDAAELYRLITRERIACAEFVPVVIRELMAYLQTSGQSLDMQCLIVGSDVWRIDEYRRLQDCCGPQTSIISSYGVSEATIDSTFFVECDRLLPPDRVVPIGQPFANTQIYILDRAFEPVPPGITGELYIGGVGLARGYQRRPDLTAARFIPHRWAEQRGARLYRTGDLARYLPDGNVEFVGRSDHQVKVRGFRIELGEIEAALAQHPAIQDVAVSTWQGKRGDTQIVAYIVPAAQADLTSQQIRDFLKSRLPAHMIPAALIALDALPLTPNGKIDRRALPAPDASESIIADEFVAPSTPTEQLLAAIWSEVLQHEPIGVHDDFFALGGHSLLATQVISRLRTALQIELPLRILFEQPTIAGCAAEIEQRQQQGERVASIVPVPRDGPLPLSFSQQRLWFLDQFDQGTPAYNMVNSVRLRGELHVPALRQALDEIVRRHESLRTIFALQDGQAVQLILPPTGATFRRIDLREHAPAERLDQARWIVAAETQHAFDLAAGPLFRATLIQLEPQSHILCLNVHHIVSDGWSESIFLRELAAIYHAFRAGESSPLPALPIQYADFACWQQRLLKGAYLEQQLDYWRAQLGDEYAPLPLPLDRPRPPIRTSAGARLPYRVDRPLAAALKALAS